jgi:hypothetical protein
MVTDGTSSGRPRHSMLSCNVADNASNYGALRAAGSIGITNGGDAQSEENTANTFLHESPPEMTFDLQATA